ncbi:P-loop containing nucleoside triphosphate hydrolase [Fusarium albosuccineum]|uniref:P-loop containing nucleoside triphosphate hydrolase n=1 Tax=Fusarium albosuccineum TaxID=1237068 RepID=A0A8H4L3S1_9HYPO|nr:P-loop containing nucleoside triphosphate hydrolase [Fusarium albosuccineum]
MAPLISITGPSPPDPSAQKPEPSTQETTEENTDEAKTLEELKKREKILRVDQIWDRKTQRYRFVKTAKPKNKKKKFGHYVITVARRISNQGTFHGDFVVDIRGPYLQEILSQIYREVDNISFDEVPSLDSKELELLFHALPVFVQKLDEQKKSKDPNHDMIFELEAVVAFTQEHFESRITKLQHFQTTLQIEFHSLWALFPPHCLAYGQDSLRQGRVYRVKNSAYEKNQDGSTNYLLAVDYLDSDGELVGYVRERPMSIPQFEGYVSIFDLTLFPLELHQSYPTILQDLVDRGDKVLKLRGRHFQDYKGHALDEKGQKFNSHGRVMIDPVTLEEIQPRNLLVPVIRKPLLIDNLTSEQKLLLNPVLYGFSLGDKTWGAFAVSGLKDVDWDDEMVNYLVLDQRRKDFIHALIRHHCSKSSEGFDDFVRDKGKGLVGLLAGPPGVGKTFTAEAVAEIAHRPLYMISSGELGEDSHSVQKRLIEVLELAEMWQAVVLLDEADVFLAQRDNENLSRNAITSVFLRHLEYYQGILLLTTNRLDTFDEAFQSRIHFCFQYEDLDAAARGTLWSEFLNRVKETTSAEIRVDETEMNRLSEIKLNGRQIKNVISIAQAVATEEKKPLTLDGIFTAIGFAQIAWEPATEAGRRTPE